MVKVLSLFSGIGADNQALTNIGIKHITTMCEIDKYAVQTYNMIHGNTPNLGDITKVDVDTLKEGQFDLFTYSFPCQSISTAGKQEGLAKGSGTESSLLWECEKIIRKVKPKYLLMENVAALVSDKFMPYFQKWLDTLDDLGYTNYWQILNAKNYGIPQNRERVFCVSILGTHYPYQFPQPVPLKLRLKDMLEKDVEEKYYLSDKMVTFLVKNNDKQKERGNGFRFLPQKSEQAEICNSITTQCGGRPTDTFIEQRIEINKNGLCNTLTTVQKDNYVLEPKITIDKNVKPSVAKNFEREKEEILKSDKEIYQAQCDSGWQDNKIGLKVSPTIRANNSDTFALDKQYRIRKLTPRECFRLMGFKDEQFDKIKGISAAQLYKQAGNSIVVNVLEAIFRQLFLADHTGQKQIEHTKTFKQMDLF